jgi:putative ABC transport system permease protein
MTDMKLGLRALLKEPSYAAVAVLTLAIAVGGATAIFSVLNAVVLRPLPYAESDRLVIARESFMPRLPEFSVSPGHFLEWQARTRTFDGLAASENASVNLTGVGDPERLRAALVTENLFSLLGMGPLAGRTFTNDEMQPGAPQVAVISEALWRGRFAGAADIVGRKVLLDDTPVTVVGVMPAAFTFPAATAQVQVWLPKVFSADERRRYGSHYLACVARLKTGVTIEAARDDLGRAAREIVAIDSDSTGWTTLLFPMLEFTVRNVKSGLWVLAGAVSVLLLIACANIANLLLARGIGRQRELGVRAALGATRMRLVRQLLGESAMIGVLGSVAGLGLAWIIIRAVTASPTISLPRSQAIALDGQTLFFALLLAGLTPIIFGLLPAVQVSRADLQGLLAHGGRSGASSIKARTRALLIVAEVALAVVLVAGSILLIRSFARLMDVSPGFETNHQLVVGLSLPDTRYPGDEKRDLFWTTLVDRLSHLPGVTAVGVAQSMPFLGDNVTTFEIPGRTPTDVLQKPNANFYAVGPRYFEAMGIRLLRGRAFAEADGPESPRVSIISRTLAARYFGTTDPIGQRVHAYQGPTNDLTYIVGVVDDVKQYGLDRDTPMEIYQPARQHAYFGAMNVVIRTIGAPDNATAAARAALAAIDPNLPMANARTLASIEASSVGPRRFTTTLLGAFAGVALLLAFIGVYGLVSFSVGQRTQEIGIRMALGARPMQVIALVFRQGMGFTLAGGMIGVVAGLEMAKLMEAQLFEVQARDPLAFSVAPIVLLVASAIACYVPARRATKVNPVAALRS